jgi:acid phosphatase family membrane protein YuiD
MTFNQAAMAVLVSVLIAFLVKGVVSWRRGEGFVPFGLGGMPSSHANAVGSLVAIVYLETGLSLLLIVVGVFGVLFLRDAYGVRWEVTKHSVALNKLMRSKEHVRTGHTRAEVIVGALLGVVVTTVAYLLLA